jgi:hypothetical protein
MVAGSSIWRHFASCRRIPPPPGTGVDNRTEEVGAVDLVRGEVESGDYSRRQRRGRVAMVAQLSAGRATAAVASVVRGQCAARMFVEHGMPKGRLCIISKVLWSTILLLLNKLRTNPYASYDLFCQCFHGHLLEFMPYKLVYLANWVIVGSRRCNLWLVVYRLSEPAASGWAVSNPCAVTN